MSISRVRLMPMKQHRKSWIHSSHWVWKPRLLRRLPLHYKATIKRKSILTTASFSLRTRRYRMRISKLNRWRVNHCGLSSMTRKWISHCKAWVFIKPRFRIFRPTYYLMVRLRLLSLRRLTSRHYSRDFNLSRLLLYRRVRPLLLSRLSMLLPLLWSRRPQRKWRKIFWVFSIRMARRSISLSKRMV